MLKSRQLLITVVGIVMVVMLVMLVMLVALAAIAALVVMMIAILYSHTPNVQEPTFRWLSPGPLALVAFALASLGFIGCASNFRNYADTRDFPNEAAASAEKRGSESLHSCRGSHRVHPATETR